GAKPRHGRSLPSLPRHSSCRGSSCRGEPPGQAARTVSRNLPTSTLRRLLSPESDCAAASSCVEAEPVSLAPRRTSVMLAETCCVPWAACCTLREIYWVAETCSASTSTTAC